MEHRPHVVEMLPNHRSLSTRASTATSPTDLIRTDATPSRPDIARTLLSINPGLGSSSSASGALRRQRPYRPIDKVGSRGTLRFDARCRDAPYVFLLGFRYAPRGLARPCSVATAATMFLISLYSPYDPPLCIGCTSHLIRRMRSVYLRIYTDIFRVCIAARHPVRRRGGSGSCRDNG